ncbi:MAG TPA: hypothetical protein VE685_14870 [Thermoanaerobaculia bacterium]|nr:hypothetical protein [Thermoanaerobaculia bacterium]
MLNPNEITIYAALAGAVLDVNTFDLGHGVALSRKTLHVSAESLLGLLPSIPEANHPALRALARSGAGFDLFAQLSVPAEFRPERWLDRVNTVWWIVTLLRLRCTPEVRIPLLASEPWFPGEPSPAGVEYWPVEIEGRRLPLEPGASPRIGEEDLRWVEAHWFHSGRLVVRKPPFNRLLKCLDKAYIMTDPAVSLVSLWEGLERLLAPAGKLDRNVPEGVAAFLESPGEARRKLGDRVGLLYEARALAEEGLEPPEGCLAETYAIVKRVCLKIVEEERVPTREEIERGRFVGLN